MDFGILGPVEVRDRGRPLDLGTRKSKLAFVALLLHAGHVVSIDELIDCLWGEAPPATAEATLHSYVSRLRGALSSERDRLETRSPGYLLRADDDEIDARRFERLVEAGRADRAGGDAGGAAAQLREGLRLFRGPPLADFVYEPFAEAEATRLSALRVDALEERIEAELALGLHHEAVAELEALVSAYPLRERLWQHLILALYRIDRQGDALHAFQKLREVLTEELGVDPSPQTLELELQIREHRSDLDYERDTHPVATAEVGPSGTPVAFPAALRAVRRGPFVGRSPARARLDAGEGTRPTITVVLGEPGIGKTRLVAEVAVSAWESGTTVLFGRCTEPPLWHYEPFVDALDAYLGPDEAGPVVARIGDQAAELARLLPNLHHRVPGLTHPPRADPDAARYLLFRAVDAVIADAAVNGPVLLIIDDIHLADASVLALLSHVSAAHDPAVFRVLATARDTDLDANHPIAVLQRDRWLDAVRLKGLAAEEVMALVAQIGPADPTPGLGHAIHTRTGGNPFFVEELVRSLDSLGPDDGAALAPTEGIRAVIDRRLQALSAAARGALQIAAVVGGEFGLDTVRRVGGSEASEGIDEAARAQIVREAGQPGHGEFAHALVRDTIEAGLGPSVRADLHHRVGEALEAAGWATSDRGLATLAHHYGAAGTPADVRRAADYARRSADLAFEAYRYEEAADRYAYALALARRRGPAQDAEILLELTQARIRAGRRDEARRSAIEAVDAARRESDPRLLARAAHLSLESRPDPSLAPLLQEALTRLGDHDDALRASLLVDLAWQLVATTRRSEADDLLRVGAALAERTDNLEAQTAVLQFRWEFLTTESSPADRLAAANGLLARARVARDDQTAMWAHTHRAIGLLELGDLAGCEEAITAHERLAGESRQPEMLAANAQRRAMRAILRGRWDEAEECANESLLHMPGDPAYVPIYGGQIAAIRKEQGRPEGMAELFLSDEANRDRAVSRACAAMFHVDSGRVDDGRALLDELLAEGLDRVPGDMFWLLTMSLMADTAVGLEECAFGVEVFDALEPLQDRMVTFGYCAVFWGAVHRFLAPLAVLLDRPEEAVGHYTAAIAVHERMGARSFLARDQLGLARLLAALGGDEQRIADLEAAGLGTARELDLQRVLADFAGAPARWK